MPRSGLRITSFRAALLGAMAVLAILGAADWAFEHGVYKPAVIGQGQVTANNGGSHVTARTRLLAIGKRSLWQVELSPGDWRDCGNNCEQALLRSLAK